MPSQRKRIGYLPRAEIQNIIDQICKYNKISQSKVTGILVEEALIYRGVLYSTFNEKSDITVSNNNKSILINNDALHNENLNKNDNNNLEEKYINNEVKMINDYIEYKIFKKIMKNKKNPC